MDDLTLIELLRGDLSDGRQSVLCTVVGSQGSAPRGAGARMAIRADGSALGTIGGGSVERLAMERARGLLAGEGASGLEEYTTVSYTHLSKISAKSIPGTPPRSGQTSRWAS